MAVKVKFYERPANIEEVLRLKIEAFLERYIPEGTVLMGPDVYRSANMWSVAYGEQDSILGFAAHRVVSLPGGAPRGLIAGLPSRTNHGDLSGSRTAWNDIFFAPSAGADILQDMVGLAVDADLLVHPHPHTSGLRRRTARQRNLAGSGRPGGRCPYLC
jgi:hypothetical protein